MTIFKRIDLRVVTLVVVVGVRSSTVIRVVEGGLPIAEVTEIPVKLEVLAE